MVRTGVGGTDADRATRFQQIALPHLNAAHNLARWLTKNDFDAEDIVQEAYLRAFKYFHTFSGSNARAGCSASSATGATTGCAKSARW